MPRPGRSWRNRIGRPWSASTRSASSTSSGISASRASAQGSARPGGGRGSRRARATSAPAGVRARPAARPAVGQEMQLDAVAARQRSAKAHTSGARPWAVRVITRRCGWMPWTARSATIRSSSCGRAEHRDVMHVAPARGARILDDADHPQVGRGGDWTAPTNKAAIGPQPYSSTGTSRVVGGRRAPARARLAAPLANR